MLRAHDSTESVPELMVLACCVQMYEGKRLTLPWAPQDEDLCATATPGLSPHTLCDRGADGPFLLQHQNILFVVGCCFF